MAKASASAIGSACALRRELGLVVQALKRPLFSDCTVFGSGDLADATTTSQLDTLIHHGGGLPQQVGATALRELVAALVAMADGRPSFGYCLFYLDPGLDKTMMLTHLAQQLLKS